MKKISKFFKWFFDYSTKDYMGLVILIFLLLLGGWFYWFQYRPAEIRKECSQVREEYIDKLADDSSYGEEKGKIYESDIRFADFKYDRCLSGKGLK